MWWRILRNWHDDLRAALRASPFLASGVVGDLDGDGAVGAIKLDGHMSRGLGLGIRGWRAGASPSAFFTNSFQCLPLRNHRSSNTLLSSLSTGAKSSVNSILKALARISPIWPRP